MIMVRGHEATGSQPCVASPKCLYGLTADQTCALRNGPSDIWRPSCRYRAISLGFRLVCQERRLWPGIPHWRLGCRNRNRKLSIKETGHGLLGGGFLQLPTPLSSWNTGPQRSCSCTPRVSAAITCVPRTAFPSCTLSSHTSTEGLNASLTNSPRRYSCIDWPLKEARAASSSRTSSGTHRIVILFIHKGILSFGPTDCNEPLGNLIWALISEPFCL